MTYEYEDERADAPDLNPRKRIALVAYDNEKPNLLVWADYNRDLLTRHDVYATGTTG